MRIPLAMVVLGACGGSGPTHWKDQPLETVDSTFRGTHYTIEIPKGMKKSPSEYSDEFQYHAEQNGEGYVFAPSLMIGKSSSKKTLADAIKEQKMPVIDKAEQPGGWAFAVENDSQKKGNDFIIESEVENGDIALTCHARVYAMEKGEDVKALIPRVFKMCLSLKGK